MLNKSNNQEHDRQQDGSHQQDQQERDEAAAAEAAAKKALAEQNQNRGSQDATYAPVETKPILRQDSELTLRLAALAQYARRPTERITTFAPPVVAPPPPGVCILKSSLYRDFIHNMY